MELKNADETLKNLRVYGTEKAPVEGNQFGSRTAVENFLKSAGLSVERAAEEARKLYAKQGTSGGALNAAELQGIKDGQFMTPQQLANFKTASALLLEVAEKAKADEARRSKYEDKLERNRSDSENSQGSLANSRPSDNDIKAEQERIAEMHYKHRQAELEKMRASSANAQDIKNQEAMVKRAADALRQAGGSTQQPVIPQSTLNAIADLSRPAKNSAQANGSNVVKKIELDLTFNGNTVPTEVNADQEGLLMAFVKALEDSKAISGQ